MRAARLRRHRRERLHACGCGGRSRAVALAKQPNEFFAVWGAQTLARSGKHAAQRAFIHFAKRSLDGLRQIEGVDMREDGLAPVTGHDPDCTRQGDLPTATKRAIP